MTPALDPNAHEWDVIIFGAGMAGATLGYALAKAGKKVLFCEQGGSYLTDVQSLKGDYAETFFDWPEAPQPKHKETLQRASRWWDEIDDVSNVAPRSFIPFIGAGAGGSSALFGMALERFFPNDFTPGQHHPNAHEADLPAAWPISSEELKPYYAQAERLYRVRGGADPLKGDTDGTALLPPPRFSPASKELSAFLKAKGLNPYHLPLACEHVPGCSGCQGYLCPRNCKNDSARICLAPAIALHGATVLERCRLVKLEASKDAVTQAVCIQDGRTFTLTADTFVLAAGALATPAILLRSASADWPQGLANDSGLVGRFLMRHFVDLYPTFAHTTEPHVGNSKQLAFNDFYLTGGLKLGSVQSFGSMPPTDVIIASLKDDARHGPLGRAAAGGVALMTPVLRLFLQRLFNRATVLASVLEDLPYADNRVTISEAGRLAISYRIRDYDQDRIRVFREKISASLSPYRFMLFKQAENNQRLAHVCGTCRFGADPRRSVLNANNRAHGVKNLYVVDASFFPSSGGTNPALTIAANALRVADHMIGPEVRDTNQD